MDGLIKTTNNIKKVYKSVTIAALLCITAIPAIAATEEAELNSTEIDTTEVYTVVDEMPEIIGGLQAIYGRISYPRAAVRAGVEGRVFIQFVVDKEGNVQDPKVLRDIGAGCGDAAIEAIKDVKFTPGRLNGEIVNVQYSMPVTFRLENK